MTLPDWTIGDWALLAAIGFGLVVAIMVIGLGWIAFRRDPAEDWWEDEDHWGPL